MRRKTSENKVLFAKFSSCLANITAIWAPSCKRHLNGLKWWAKHTGAEYLIAFYNFGPAQIWLCDRAKGMEI